MQDLGGRWFRDGRETLQAHPGEHSITNNRYGRWRIFNHKIAVKMKKHRVVKTPDDKGL